MRKLFLALALLFAPSLYATNAVYISQNGSGTQDGLSCANAKPASYFNTSGNWTGSPSGIQIGPDTTVHTCGTFTGTANSTMLTFQGSGTSGHPVILFAESGTNFTAPYWSLSGAINVNGKNFVTLNGNGRLGIIQNTANGNGLAFAAGSYAIFASGVHDVTIQGWTVANICVKFAGTTTGCSTSNVPADGIVINGGSNNVVNNNLIHDVHWAVLLGFPSGTSSNGLVVSNNTIYNMDHGVAVGNSNSGSAALTGLQIFGNTMHDMANWDGSAGFHHDYIHIFMGGTTNSISGVQIYNNYVYGNPGSGTGTSGGVNAFFYLENPTGNTFSGTQFFNNVLVNNSTNTPPYGYISTSGSNVKAYNNTIVGANTSQGNANACFFFNPTGAATNADLRNNTCQTVGLFVLVNSGSLSIANTSNNNNWFNGGGFYYAGAYNSFSTWKTSCSCDAAGFTTAPNVQTISPFTPNTGSPLIGAGANLTSLSITPLNSDINGVSRPGIGAWDIGAAQSGIIAFPGAPSSLATSVSFSTVNLSWAASSGTVSGYTVKRGTVSGGPYTQVATNITGTTYADTNLPGGTYYYVVNAFNSAGPSGNSNQATAIVQPQVVPPSAPATLTATASGMNINLSWAAALGTPTNYLVKRATVSGGPYTTIATLSLVTSYVDSGLGNGTYYYVINASNTAGTSPNSPQASATISTSPALSLLPSASQNFGQTIIGQTANSCGSGNCIVSVNSTGTAALVLAGSNAVTLSGANAADFSISATTCTNGLSLSPNTSCTVTLTFTPSTSGTEVATLVIISNDPSSPDTVSLSGVGVVPLVISPNSINFGNVFTNKTSSTQTVTVQNNSGSTVTFSSIALTTGTQFHIVSNTCGGSVANNTSCSIGLTFAPTSVANFTDTLTFTDSASTSPQTVALSGRGKKHGVLRVGAAVNWPGGRELIYTILREAWGGRETLLDTL